VAFGAITPPDAAAVSAEAPNDTVQRPATSMRSHGA
jgi:hypothetical protein